MQVSCVATVGGEQETEGVRTNSSERGKEVRVMSNRGEETKREEAWKRRKKKKNKNIFRPTHWASGWERNNCNHVEE